MNSYGIDWLVPLFELFLHIPPLPSCIISLLRKLFLHIKTLYAQRFSYYMIMWGSKLHWFKQITLSWLLSWQTCKIQGQWEWLLMLNEMRCNILKFCLLVDPFSMATQKALESIGKTLTSQYERWQPKVGMHNWFPSSCCILKKFLYS